jgi:hypothetical protein
MYLVPERIKPQRRTFNAIRLKLVAGALRVNVDVIYFGGCDLSLYVLHRTTG